MTLYYAEGHIRADVETSNCMQECEIYYSIMLTPGVGQRRGNGTAAAARVLRANSRRHVAIYSSEVRPITNVFH